jgi:hypothetical protein
MAALAPFQPTPLMVQLPNGALVPASSLVQPEAAPPIAGAELNDTGALAPASDIAPANTGAIPTRPTNVVPFPNGKGGAANSGAVLAASDHAPILQTGDNGGGPDISAIVAKLAKAAGSTGAANPTGSGIADAAAALSTPAPAAAAPPTDTAGGGIFDRIRELLLGPKTTPPVNATQAALTPNTTAPTTTGGALPMGTAGPTGAGSPVNPPPPAGALPPEPDYFTRLQKNPLALALLTGGLSMMSAASRPGATVGGAFGEGALSGVNAVYGERAAEEQRALDAIKAQHEGALQDSEAAEHNANAGAIPIKAAADTTTAGANATRAAADATKADKGHFGNLVAGTGIDPGTGKTVPGVWQADLNGGPPRFTPGATLTGKPGGGAANSVFAQKTAAWLALHPGDQKGALDYAGGHKQLSDTDLSKSAYTLAESELKSLAIPPDDPSAWVDKRSKEIATKLRGAQAATPPAGGGGAVPPKAANTNNAASLGLPPVAKRVVGKTTWKAPDGKVYTWTKSGWL